ncbi:MAG: NAD(P)-binding protein [Fusobacteriaceae bacterium]|jgi:uncharacterized FAD-dependent dehydrogenase|nr:NAD(P)-binding protein [Fusobacteriaceae bacterium]
MKVIVDNILVSVEEDQDAQILRELEKRGIDRENIQGVVWNKRSLDMRQKRRLRFIYSLTLSLKNRVDLTKKTDMKLLLEEKPKMPEPRGNGRPVLIVGTGPAGLFAALRLARLGYLPLLYEMGEPVGGRVATVERFTREGILDPRSNIQFGEGGAGTFSDGKLNTRTKSAYIGEVFREFVACGADPGILWDYKPHVGTDVLKDIVRNLRGAIEDAGGIFHFGKKLEDIRITEGKLKGVVFSDRRGSEEQIPCDRLILAVGHSSRDTCRMLYRRGVAMEGKAFAMGVRIEHLQSRIDRWQYGEFAGHPALGPASYALTRHNWEEDRGTFTFCMCPGGEIVNASSDPQKSLVNGMSNSARDGRFANAGVVVGVRPGDFGEGIFAGMEFQELLEAKAYEYAGGYGALYQRAEDFLRDRKTGCAVESSYRRPLVPFPFKEFFPQMIVENMQKTLEIWKKTRRFPVGEANLIGPETRTSSPVRILRNERGESVNVAGLYPIGEGSGYAGGITSSAVDGLKIVDLNF